MSELEGLDMAETIAYMRAFAKTSPTARGAARFNMAADALDSTRPQRAPVEGQCPCPGNPWVWDPDRGVWERGTGPNATSTTQIFCGECGAALREGYAERCGDGLTQEEQGTLLRLDGVINREEGSFNAWEHIAYDLWPKLKPLIERLDAASPAEPGSDERGEEEG